MAKDIHAEITLARSILTELEKYTFPKKLSIDGVRIAEHLVSTADAERIFSKDFLARVSIRVVDLKNNMVKKPEKDERDIHYLSKKLKSRR